MATKTNNAATKTLNPLHFEALEPHRFEDLVRQLIYDFKDWQSIEATGQGGSDDGFDIRAREKNEVILNKEDEDNEEEVVGQHPMEGNLWMVQCKREKSINNIAICSSNQHYSPSDLMRFARTDKGMV
jgi:hypothetical protein